MKAGERAPDFALPAIDGSSVELSAYRNRKNIVISFIPAAWTPVCSDQWPVYNLARFLFENHNAILPAISVDNRATLSSRTRQMGKLWFPVLSDFWPHRAVADASGVLRSDGTAERALIIIHLQGVIAHIHVSYINKRAPLELIAEQLKKMDEGK